MSVGFEVLWALEDGPASFPCVDCGLLTGNFCDGSWRVGFDGVVRATECQRIMPMRLNLGINALHCVVIAKHSLITADFVVQSQVAHQLPGLTTGQEFH